MRLTTPILIAGLIVAAHPARAYDASSIQAVSQYLMNAFHANPALSTHKLSTIHPPSSPPSVALARRAWQMLDFSEKVGTAHEAPAGFSRQNHRNSQTGFYAAVFSNSGEAILAFRGSELGAKDWITNGLAAGGTLPAQYKQAIALVKAFRRDHAGKRLMLTGHSLGGGLAATAALYSGIPAMVFDSAGTAKVVKRHVERQLKADGQKRSALRRNARGITNFNLRGEFVSDKDGQMDADVLGDKAWQFGTVYYLDDARFNPLDRLTWDTPLRRHFTTPLKEELRFLGLVEYRQSRDLDRAGNALVANATKTWESPCLTLADYRLKDCTEDGFDIFSWEALYFFNSLPSMVEDLFVPAQQ